MNAKIIYLDSSAIIKRYIDEPGTSMVRKVFLEAYTGETRIAFSIWNIGEVLGAFDKARRLGRIAEREHILVRGRFLSELKRMIKLNILIIIPIKAKILKEAWRIIEKYHVYQADALQVASAKYVSANMFLTGDVKLHNVALTEGLESIALT